MVLLIMATAEQEYNYNKKNKVTNHKILSII